MRNSGESRSEGTYAAPKFGQGLPPKRRHHLTEDEKLQQAAAKIRQAHSRQARATPQQETETADRNSRSYALGKLHGLGQAVSYLNEVKP